MNPRSELCLGTNERDRNSSVCDVIHFQREWIHSLTALAQVSSTTPHAHQRARHHTLNTVDTPPCSNHQSSKTPSLVTTRLSAPFQLENHGLFTNQKSRNNIKQSKQLSYCSGDSSICVIWLSPLDFAERAHFQRKPRREIHRNNLPYFLLMTYSCICKLIILESTSNDYSIIVLRNET